MFVLFSVVVVDLIAFGMIIPILPFYAEIYGASGLQLGFLFSVFAIMQFIFAPMWGRLSDRIGRKPVIIITILGLAMSLVVLGFSKSLLWLFVARILGGFFGANISVATAYVTDITTPETRAKGMGMIGAAFGIGFIIGPAFAALLYKYGIHVPIFAAAALSALNGLAAIIRLKEPETHKERVRDGQTMLEHLSDKYISKICKINFLFTVGLTSIEVTFAYYMLKVFSYDARQVAWLLVLMAVIMVVIQGGMIRRLAPKYGERRLLIVGFALLAIGFGLIPLMTTVKILLIPLAILSVGRAIAQPSIMSLASFGSDEASRGAVMGVFQSSASLGRAIGPAIAGFLFDIGVGIPYYAAAAVVAIITVMSITIPRESTS